jgi:hypothetical protein
MAGQVGVTDAAFKHLRRIRVLNKSQCTGIVFVLFFMNGLCIFSVPSPFLLTAASPRAGG